LVFSNRERGAPKKRYGFDVSQSHPAGVTIGLTIAHPQMANLPDICVLLKILSSEYQLYACGKIFRTP